MAAELNSRGWVTITELATMKGVGKPAISERVAKLEQAGRLNTRREGRLKLVNLAEFDVAVGETTDFARAQTALTKRALPPPEQPASGGPSYTAEQARHMAYKADLAEIELKRRRSEILEIGDVTRAMTRCAEAMVKVIDQMPSRADEVAAAVARDGSSGARQALRSLARDLRDMIGREMRLLLDEGRAAENGQSESTETDLAEIEE